MSVPGAASAAWISARVFSRNFTPLVLANSIFRGSFSMAAVAAAAGMINRRRPPRTNVHPHLLQPIPPTLLTRPLPHRLVSLTLASKHRRHTPSLRLPRRLLLLLPLRQRRTCLRPRALHQRARISEGLTSLSLHWRICLGMRLAIRASILYVVFCRDEASGWHLGSIRRQLPYTLRVAKSAQPPLHYRRNLTLVD